MWNFEKALFPVSAIAVESHYKSSNRTCSLKKLFLKISQKFTGKHQYWNRFLIKLQPFRLANLWKSSSAHEILQKCLRIDFLKNISGRVPLSLLQSSDMQHYISSLFHDGSRYHVGTSPLICSKNQLTGFYMIGTSVMKVLEVIPAIFLNVLLILLWCSIICIVIICFPVYDAIDFEINLSFLIKPFSYFTKKVRTKI